MNIQVLAGRKILLVEDDYFQAQEIKAMLERAGAQVIGPTGRAAKIGMLMAEDRPDAAIIDLNLGAGVDYGPAIQLQELGVPFAFLTGYDKGALPTELSSIPTLQKPASEHLVIQMLSRLA